MFLSRLAPLIVRPLRKYTIVRPTAYKACNAPVSKLAAMMPKIRQYSGPAILSMEEIEERILGVLRAFDRVKADKVSVDARFTSDLGLDSLDVVEVMIAMEEEFMLEIPDEVADKISSPKEVAEYIFKAQAH